MACLSNRVSLSIGDLENMLGSQKLPGIVEQCEERFLSRVDAIAEKIVQDTSLRAIFLSGPTASGKTTFTNRMVSRLQAKNRPAFCLSLDNYYQLSDLHFDEKGRPDYESIETLNLPCILRDIRLLLEGEEVCLSEFHFGNGGSSTVSETPVRMKKDEILLIEGLHSLSTEISGAFSREMWAGIFLMPWGGVVSDRRLVESRDVRLFRRLIRDSRHRNAGAVATLDYWPMVISSEQHCFGAYLRRADFYMNTMLDYETMITAPLAISDILRDLEMDESGALSPSGFIRPYHPDRSFADKESAVRWAKKWIEDLSLIPACDGNVVPPHSILHEFI